MKKLGYLIVLIGSMRIGNVFAIELNSNNIISLGCPISATSCDLSNKGITSIATGTFTNHSSLYRLSLYKNSISVLQSGAFNGLYNLINLDLSYNTISQIYSGAFNSLNKLTSLTLSHNQRSNLDPNVFDSTISGVIELDLNDNGITTIPTNFFSHFNSLRNLYLYYNQISQINSGTFTGLFNSLVTLNLSNNSITDILSTSFTSFTKLSDLDLKDNNIQNIEPGSFSGLKLYSLSLSNTVPLYAGVFQNLSVFRLGTLSIDRLNTANILQGITFLANLTINIGENAMQSGALSSAFSSWNTNILQDSVISGWLNNSYTNKDGLPSLLIYHSASNTFFNPGSFLGLNNLKSLYFYGDSDVTESTSRIISAEEFKYTPNLKYIRNVGQTGYFSSRNKDYTTYLSGIVNMAVSDDYCLKLPNLTDGVFEGMVNLTSLNICIGHDSGPSYDRGRGRALRGTESGGNIYAGAFSGINKNIPLSVRLLVEYIDPEVRSELSGFTNLSLDLYYIDSDKNYVSIPFGGQAHSTSGSRVYETVTYTGGSDKSTTIWSLSDFFPSVFKTINSKILTGGNTIYLIANKVPTRIYSGAFNGLETFTGNTINVAGNIKCIDRSIWNQLNSFPHLTIRNNGVIINSGSTIGECSPNISYSTTGTTNGNVIATINLNEAKSVSNNNGSHSYTFTENGSFTFEFIDAAGNTGSIIATVSWINNGGNTSSDTTPPIGTISYSTTNTTSGNVTATISLNEPGIITNNSGSNSHIFTQNGSFTFTFADSAGNTGSQTATVSWINNGSNTSSDTTPPIGTISYSPSADTEVAGNVVATISLNEPGSITSAGGATHTFTSNGDFLFEFQDSAGNKSSATASVDWIINTFVGKTVNNTLVKNNGIYNADIKFSFNNNNGVVATLDGVKYKSGTLISSEGLDKEFLLTDQDGYTTVLVFSIDKTAPTCVVSDVTTLSGTYLDLGRDCSDNFGLSGLTLTINDENNNLLYMTGLNASATDFKYATDGGNYKRKIIATDKAGNKSTMNYQTIKYIKTTAITISPSGYFYDDIYYVSGYRAILGITGNTRFGFKILGDISNTIIGSYNTGVLNQTIVLDQGEGLKNIVIDYITNNQSNSGSIDPISFYVDTTSPTITTIFPTDLSNNTGSSMYFERSATDTGVGISGYVLEVTRSTRKPTLVYLGANSTSYTLNKMSNGTYTWKIKAIDYAGNSKETDYNTFILGTTVTSGDVSPDSFSLDKEYDADLDEEYQSEIVTVSGLSSGTKVLAYVSNGSLIINGDDVGTTGYVQNDDEVQISIYSSEDYDDLTSGILTIGDQSSKFKVITIAENNDNESYTISSLSSSEKLNLSLVYNALLNIYDEDEQDDFMLSFKYIVKDKIEAMVADNEEETKVEKMKYLYNIINKNFKGEDDTTIIDATEDEISSDESIKYTAPNGKEYTITYDSKGYTSSNFLKTGKYFNSLTEIKTYINKNNPKSPYRVIDFTIDTSWTQSHTAPNGKKYILFKTTDGRYGSNSFIYGKTFTSLSAIQSYIDQNNR